MQNNNPSSSERAVNDQAKNDQAAKTPSGLKQYLDLAGLVGFALTYFLTKNFMLATSVLVAGSLIAVGIGLIIEKKIAMMPLISAIAAVVFGGATLLFHDPRILKMKMTIMYGILGAVLLGGLLYQKMFLKMLLGHALPLKEEAWPILTWVYAGYFIILAIANEIIWRAQTEEFWVQFKLISWAFPFILMILTLPFIMKSLKPEALEDTKKD